MAEWGWLLAAPVAFPEVQQGVIKASKSTKHKVDGSVGCGGVDGCGDVGDADAGGGAVGCVALVVPGTW